MKKILFIALLASCSIYAQTIVKSSIDSGGGSVSAGNIQMVYTIGEVMVQERSAGNIQLSEGFINPTSIKVSVNPKVFLQGPFTSAQTSGLMNDNLRVNNQLPTTSPYADGLTCDVSVFSITGSEAIVDWVLLELRDAADRSIVIESRSALLQRDGDIVDVDGTLPVNFNSPRGTYYINVGHRNHLSILSATPIAITSSTSVDLSEDPIAVYGGLNAVSNVSGVFAMVSGDVTPNGEVQTIDLNNLSSALGASGYTNLDADLNGELQTIDINLHVRPNLGRGIQY
ncbi:MAG: hemagglutinin protein [Patiriisocius sp.]|uniref:hemagglutinin protein n=1 Tax=Patiriisocius sp. TaxID=2822396 RepID=UPI003EF11D7B